MLQKYLEPDQNEHDAAQNIRFVRKAGTEAVADGDTREGNAERDRADKEHRGQNVGVQKCERNARSERVNAGGYGEHEHAPNGKRVTGFAFPVLFEAVNHHLAAEKTQQRKRDPMVELCDIRRELPAQCPADEGHERLKAAEEQRDHRSVLKAQFFHAKPLAQRRGKRIHRKPHGEDNDLKKAQKKTPPTKKSGASVRYAAKAIPPYTAHAVHGSCYFMQARFSPAC